MKQAGSHRAEAIGSAEREEAEVVCDRIIDDFSTATPGRFPPGWGVRDAGDREPAQSRFVVEVDGVRHVLHATYADRTITIGRPVPGWDLEKYPILSWDWKAVSLPEGGDERRADRNDSAASVYAVWRAGFPWMVRGIRYAWSSTVPAGTHISKRFGYDQVLILETGRQHAGRWRSARANVLEHSRKFFDERDVEPPQGVALTTDADATASQAEAYYADFRLCHIENRAGEATSAD